MGKVFITCLFLAGCELGVAPDEESPGTNNPPGTENPTEEGATTVRHGCQIYPNDNPWNQDISDLPVHERSDGYISSIGVTKNLVPDFGTMWEGVPIGIPYVTVDGSTQEVPVSFTWPTQSDPGPYPIPSDAPIENNGGGDAHVIAFDTDNCHLYEMFNSVRHDNGSRWSADAGAVFDLSTNELRPDGWTSADAAGLPIFPGLVSYDEVVVNKKITHAIRFTVPRSQRGYIAPATHQAGRSDATEDDPPMGLRLRMKASYDCTGLSEEVQVMCEAFKTYGLIVADNGSPWYISGVHDMRWDDDALRDLRDIEGNAFEVVYTGEIQK